jgi:hypothetical protein
VFELAVIGLDRVVRVLLDVVPCLRDQLIQHAGVDRVGVGDHLAQPAGRLKRADDRWDLRNEGEWRRQLSRLGAMFLADYFARELARIAFGEGVEFAIAPNASPTVAAAGRYAESDWADAIDMDGARSPSPTTGPSGGLPIPPCGWRFARHPASTCRSRTASSAARR